MSLRNLTPARSQYSHRQKGGDVTSSADKDKSGHHRSLSGSFVTTFPGPLQVGGSVWKTTSGVDRSGPAPVCIPRISVPLRALTAQLLAQLQWPNEKNLKKDVAVFATAGLPAYGDE